MNNANNISVKSVYDDGDIPKIDLPGAANATPPIPLEFDAPDDQSTKDAPKEEPKKHSNEQSLTS